VCTNGNGKRGKRNVEEESERGDGRRREAAAEALRRASCSWLGDAVPGEKHVALCLVAS
jgi:hypothetical protein